MASDSPFFLTKVECPICRTINEYETVRLGAYVEQGRDTDFCPTGITWRYPKYQAHNPLAFFIATCGNCFYSRELSAEFRDWKEDHAFRTYRLKTIKEKHLDQLAIADSFLKKMGEALDRARFPNESAIIKLHLAVFDELLSEHHGKLDIGRFYLRIGWVFRDLGRRENPQQSLLHALLQDLETSYRRLNNLDRQFQDQLATFSADVASHVETENLTAELKSRMYQYRDRLEQATASLQDALNMSHGGMTDLRQLLDTYKSELLGSDSSGIGPAFHQYPNFDDFLCKMKDLWDGIVTSEHEALERAVDFYKQSFVEGRDIAPGNQQLQASYLIAELSRRIGEFDQAREYFNSTIRYGQEFIYRKRHDRTQTALARKILELAIEQGRSTLASLQAV